MNSGISKPEMGVGITYSSAVIPLLEQFPGLFDLIEFEPQTAWIETGRQQHPYEVSSEILNYITQLPQRKLIHGIGTPVGGTLPPDPKQLQLLKQIVDDLHPPWFSDHLSFNQTGQFKTGFFLPPRQTSQGVEAVTRSIRILQSELQVPIAVETGVNYFKPRTDEMPDGEFVHLVTTETDCGILLDLHNLFANQMNGRQSIDQFLASISLDRVWEVHIAGGLEMEGFWLDAHSGPIPDLLWKIAYEVIPSFKNLKAIVFEIYPSFVQMVGVDRVREQIEKLRALWDSRTHLPIQELMPRNVDQPIDISGKPEDWEDSLAALVTGQPMPDSELARELAHEPGVHLIQRLIHEFRGSMIVQTLPYTSRLLMLALTPDVFRAILEKFWAQHPPYQFAVTEARAFIAFLREIDLRVPQLHKLLEYEEAIIATLVDKTNRVVTFDFDPFPLLAALSRRKLPDELGKPGLYEIELTADEASNSLEDLRVTSPFH